MELLLSLIIAIKRTNRKSLKIKKNLLKYYLQSMKRSNPRGMSSLLSERMATTSPLLMLSLNNSVN